jgi:hypothetical protein
MGARGVDASQARGPKRPPQCVIGAALARGGWKVHRTHAGAAPLISNPDRLALRCYRSRVYGSVPDPSHCVHLRPDPKAPPKPRSMPVDGSFCWSQPQLGHGWAQMRSYLGLLMATVRGVFVSLRDSYERTLAQAEEAVGRQNSRRPLVL